MIRWAVRPAVQVLLRFTARVVIGSLIAGKVPAGFALAPVQAPSKFRPPEADHHRVANITIPKQSKWLRPQAVSVDGVEMNSCRVLVGLAAERAPQAPLVPRRNYGSSAWANPLQRPRTAAAQQPLAFGRVHCYPKRTLNTIFPSPTNLSAQR